MTSILQLATDCANMYSLGLTYGLSFQETQEELRLAINKFMEKRK